VHQKNAVSFSCPITITTSSDSINLAATSSWAHTPDDKKKDKKKEGNDQVAKQNKRKPNAPAKERNTTTVTRT
jgi:hypothetical protein